MEKGRHKGYILCDSISRVKFKLVKTNPRQQKSEEWSPLVGACWGVETFCLDLNSNDTGRCT